MTKKRWTVAAASVALLGGGAWYWQNGQTAPAPVSAPAAASVQVQTAMPARHAMVVTMSVYGDVAPVKVTSLSFPQAGQLVRLAVTPGQTVRKGDIAAVITSDPACDSQWILPPNAVITRWQNARPMPVPPPLWRVL